MSVNKIIFGGDVLLDLTGDTIEASKLLSGYTAHDKSGEEITGSCTFDSNTQDATVSTSEILEGRTAYARGSKLTGDMKNNGAVAGTISTKAGTYTVPQGFHDGSGTVGIASAEQSKIIPGNIKQGISILGVEGTYSGASVKAQTKSVTPSKSAQTVQPDAGYDYLSSVSVNAIPYVETPNSAGGTTVTIG